MKSEKTSKTDKTTSRQDQDSMETEHQDSKTDTEPRSIEVESVLPLSSGLSAPSVLDAEQKRARDMLMAAELLASGYTVREVVKETGISKSLVERVSKKVRREQGKASNPRSEYLQRPYALALDQQRKDEKQSWLNEKIKSMVQDALMLSLQISIYRDVLGLGRQKNNGRQQLDINGILMAKAIGGGSLKEIGEILAVFKNMGLIGNGQQGNTFETYAKIKQLEANAIKTHGDLESAAYQRAEANATKTLIVKTIDKYAAPLVNIGKNILKPKIPNPNLETPNPVNPILAQPHSGIIAPNPSTRLEDLKLPSTASPGKTPIPQTPIPQPKEVSDHIGYSNLSPLNPANRKTKGKGV